jgi:outer membrane lipoprotein-sorting protein
MKPGAVDYFITGRFRQASNYGGEARLLREETIAAGGDAAVECYVIQIPPLGETWWVDKRRFYVVRQDGAASSTIFKTVRLNEPLSDDLFKFVPPEGATKIDAPR